MSISRRDFLAASTAGTLALSAPTLLGANSNKKYRTALIGSGWWGMNILPTAIQSGTVEVVAMCDVDRNQLDPAAKKVEQMTGSTPKKYKDYRELLEEQKPEIAIVGHARPLASAGDDRRRARSVPTCTWRSRSATRFTKARRWSRRRGKRIGWCRWGRIAACRRTTSRA